MLDKSAVNMRYHSRITEEGKRPKAGWRVATFQEWLMEKGIHLEKKDTKSILLQKCELVPIVKKYKLQGETAEYCSES